MRESTEHTSIAVSGRAPCPCTPLDEGESPDTQAIA